MSVFNWLKNNIKPKRFIILGTARTGSNYLVDLLNNSTKDVVTHGELFNLSLLDRSSLLSLFFNPVTYLDKTLNTSQKNIKAVGFKIFYYHATKRGFGNNNPGLLRVANHDMVKKTLLLLKYVLNKQKLSDLLEMFSYVWSYLKDENFLVIHLKRKNLLKTYLSLKKAYITNNWTSKDKKNVITKPIFLTHNECLSYFEQIRNYEIEHDSFFKKNKVITIYYEDLVDEPQKTTQKVTSFLGVEIISLKTVLKKQEKMNLKQSISNYLELKKSFEGTTWSNFFED